jgi:hypothetical protein
MQNEDEDEEFQDPEADREWLEGSLSELQQEGRVQQKISAEQINQMLRIQAKNGYGSVFDLINDYFPSLATAYGREHPNGGFISELDSPPEEVDLGYGPLSSSELHFDCDGVDQNAFRFYSNKDSEDNYVIHVVHKESGKKDSISGRNLESVMKQAVASGLGLHFQYELDKLQNILHVVVERKTEIDFWDYFPAPASPKLLESRAKSQFTESEPTLPTYLEYPPEPKPDSFSGSNFESAYLAWADEVKKIESEKATGQDRKGCILSIQTTKEEFQKLNLTRVEPKACFKALKGIANSTLHSLTPVEPVLKINREAGKI